MIRLYVYRKSQADNAPQAFRDGATRYIDKFENTTEADLAAISDAKVYCNAVADAMDMEETLIFVEEDYYP